MSRRGVKVELDRERRLRYTLAAMQDIEERFGVNLLAGDGIKLGQSLDDIVWVVWLGLVHAGETYEPEMPWWERLLISLGLRDAPALTEEVVAGWIDMTNVVTVTQAFAEACGGERVKQEMERAMEEGAEGDPTTVAKRLSA